ncbi:tripartite tricarboxylate transporter substrate binding protein [Alicycliphilus denitrificans]|uniref:Tripartite tricarboxylate transporter substrate binding protein n=1 Tax=Alicycliphilus denitrificans TaxID=179636 RepID=A0A3R7LEY2_9BURK|nr:tripartite tricarboxylate transporter substrate binding protein [Alicycliphilus denitrificans]RKJ96281.1 tripartite tricarboxylate transporter substrate binding protein [Alicycliphilus denitrificans]
MTIIVPYAPGGPSDVGARLLAPELSKELRAPIVVQNIAGAGGAIAAQKLLQLPADGRTLFYGSPNEMMLVPALSPSARYKAQDFAPIGIARRSAMVLVARTELPVKNVDELVQYAKARPGPLSYGSVGPGSFQHVLGAHVAALLGIEMVHVPYKGAAPMNNDLIGQQVDLAVTTLSSGTLGFVDSGRMRSLGLLTLERSPAAPHLATVQDSKALKGIDFTFWSGLFMAAATPAAAQAGLQAAFRKVVALPSVRDAMLAGGGEPVPPMPAAELQALFRDESVRYSKLVKDLGIRIDRP